MSAPDTDYFPAGFDWRRDFPETNLVRRGPSGELHLAYEDDAYWLIADDSARAGGLDPEEDAATIARLVAIQRHEETNTLVPALQQHGISLEDLQRVLRGLR